MDDDVFEFEAPAEAVPELVLGKKKKKKKKKPTKENDAAAPAPVEADPEDNDEPAPAFTSAFAALGVDDDDADDARPNDDADYQEDDAIAAPVLSKKNKKKKNKNDLVLTDPVDDIEVDEPNGNDAAPDAGNDDDLNNDSEPAPEPEQEPGPVVEVKHPMTAAEKKKAKKERERQAKLDKAKKEDEELNAILAEIGDAPATGQPGESGDAQDVADSVPMTAAQKKRAKKKKKAAAEKDDTDEVDALMAEFGGPDPSAEPQQSADAGDAGVDDLLAEFAGGDTPGAKKKSKKKKKKGAAKDDEDTGEAAADGASAASTAESKKPKKKESVAVRRMREQLEKTLAEKERLRKIQEEEDAKEAEEERQRQEEVKRKGEERARKKAAEKAKRERKKREGTLLSKAEKERKRKQEIFRQQLMSSGQIPGAAGGGASQQAEAKPTRIVYDKKKKPRQKSQEGPEATEDPQIEERSLPVAQGGADKPEVSPPEPAVVPDAWDELPDPEEAANENGGNEAPREGGSDELATQDAESEEEDDSDDSDSEYEGMTKAEIAAEKRVDAIRRARGKQKAEAMASRTASRLRSPVICILGHVDTGKTKILDRIRRTNVQDGEAGGITQQIGATYFPIDAVKKEATKVQEGKKLDYNVPSLLIIDTPGHESFTNLRSRGSSLCDIAILVVDITHGLEKQTMESIDLLKIRKTPFIVALNKIDRIFDWDMQPHNCPTRDSIAKQPIHAREEFTRRVRETQLAFSEIGFNTELYWENKDVRKTISLVPTSAISGEGIPDLLMLLLAMPQKLLTERLMFNPILEATVLEVKVIEGLGTTIDIILTGGTIREGNTIMVVGLDGPIVTTVRALLTPHPMKEMRVKGQYLHHKEIEAAQGIKISAEGLEKAVAGTQLMIVEDPTNEDEMEYVREEVMKDFQSILTNVDKSGLGVYVQASTLGSLEALLEFLRTSNIPVSGINIGPVHKRDVTKASTMLEKRKEFATILAFDVSVEKEAREMAEDVGVTIFTADIIYHLFDKFQAYMDETKKERREQVNDDVVFPSISKILPQHVYNKRDPIVVGVDVMEGILRVGTPLVVKHGDGWLDIGSVASLELNQKQVVIATKGESVAVKIQHKNTEHIMYGRHFDFQDALVSKMSRSAIDLLKESFRDDLKTEDWRLVVKLKKMFDIM